ncbi:MAG: hypothetical protein ACRDVL_06390 [Acidimicrobiia bacterium]
MWASGVEFPFYPPPGIIILLAGALFVGLAPCRWASGVGAFLGLFVTVSPTGISNLAGEAGTNVTICQGIQVIGVVTALLAGVIATRSNSTHPPAGHDHPNGEVGLPRVHGH